jgi:hypothetical protein
VPSTTFLEIPPEEQGQMRAILRRARYGSLLAFHILLLCAAGRTHGDCGLPVMLALPCVPNRASISHREPLSLTAHRRHVCSGLQKYPHSSPGCLCFFRESRRSHSVQFRNSTLKLARQAWSQGAKASTCGCRIIVIP